MTSTLIDSFLRGLKGGATGYFSPVRPRVWRHAIQLGRVKGPRAAIEGWLCSGPALIMNGSLDPHAHLTIPKHRRGDTQ